jgi:hypothetical protein
MKYMIRIYGPNINLKKYGIEAYNTNKYFCQKLDVFTKKGIESTIVITDGKNLDEIDLSSTLVEAEKKVQLLKKINKHYVFKIIEYPEGDTN